MFANTGPPADVDADADDEMTPNSQQETVCCLAGRPEWIVDGTASQDI